MIMKLQALQRRLIALRFPLPMFGADGDFGTESVIATGKALDELQVLRALAEVDEQPALPDPLPILERSQAVPADWMPSAKMFRIICHWTAGAHKASEFDRSDYHILIEDDGGRRSPRRRQPMTACASSVPIRPTSRLPTRSS